MIKTNKTNGIDTRVDGFFSINEVSIGTDCPYSLEMILSVRDFPYLFRITPTKTKESEDHPWLLLSFSGAGICLSPYDKCTELLIYTPPDITRTLKERWVCEFANKNQVVFLKFDDKNNFEKKINICYKK